MKKILLILSFAILACNLPLRLIENRSIPTPTVTATVFIPTQTPLPPPELGSKKNPLIMALAPAEHPDEDVIKKGESIAAFIEKQTGYHIVTTAPLSEASLVDAFDKGNAHIAVLSPFGYAAARKKDLVTAIMARAHSGELFYGAQFIASRESEFVSFFDSARNENTAEALVALKQFQDKKPCWSDDKSASGYVVPLGFLNQNKVRIPAGAFLEGQSDVVRAVYAADICDFGATYIDARQLPALEANYPDVSERVVVIWRIPNIIPYENISASNSLPIEMRRNIQRAFVDLMLTTEGKSSLQSVYGMDEIQIVDDSIYVEFEKYIKSSGLDLSSMLR